MLDGMITSQLLQNLRYHHQVLATLCLPPRHASRHRQASHGAQGERSTWAATSLVFGVQVWSHEGSHSDSQAWHMFMQHVMPACLGVRLIEERCARSSGPYRRLSAKAHSVPVNSYTSTSRIAPYFWEPLDRLCRGWGQGTAVRAILQS